MVVNVPAGAQGKRAVLAGGPVLVGSVRHRRAMRSGAIDTAASAAHDEHELPPSPHHAWPRDGPSIVMRGPLTVLTFGPAAVAVFTERRAT
jgi:hypothetical protein